jgi:outer membrane protein assembly factor BamB
MKRYLISILISLLVGHINAQEISTSATMFHGCEQHCGIYSGNEYKNFGKVKWKFKTNGKIFSSPAVVDSFACVGSEDSCVYAIDLLSGKLKWKFRTNGAVHSSPAVYKNTVYFGSFDGYYYAVHTNTGQEKWKVKTGGEKWVGGMGYWGMKPLDQYMSDPWDCFLSSPAIDKTDEDLTIYFGSSDGNLYAVNALDGSIKWKFQTGGIIHTTPSLYNQTVYVGSWDANLYAVDSKTGGLKWKFKTGTKPAMTGIQASPTVEDGVVYFGARDAKLYALNAFTGKLIWEYDAEGSWIVSTAAIQNNIVYVGTSDSFLLLGIDAGTGNEKLRFKANGYIFSSPAIVGNTAFFGDFTGKMFALDISSGGKKYREFITDSRKKNATSILNKDDKLDFQYAAAGKDMSIYNNIVDVMNRFYELGSIVSSPVLQNGMIYFGSADGFLYAVNLRDNVAGLTNHHHHKLK